MTMQGVGNFNGLIKHVGGVSGSIAGVSFNNVVLNSVEKNNPLLVGMGNSLKLFISYSLPPATTEVLISLFWLQRAQDLRSETETTTPASGREGIFRGLDVKTQLNLNQVAYFDVISAPSASGAPNVDHRKMHYQQISLPLTAPPVDPAILPVTGSLPITGGTGIIYECVAKADELFLISQINPDTLMTSPQNRIVIDAAIGSDALGDHK
jgi:hypothetical protein